MPDEKLYAWETVIWQWRSGGIAVYEAFIVGLAGIGCLALTLVYKLSLLKAIYALFSLRHIGLLLAVWALQLVLMEVQTIILEACSQMPPSVALMKPLRRVAQPAGHLLAACRSIIAVRDTSFYLMTSAAVSWASTSCFLVLLIGQGAEAPVMWYGVALGLLHALLVITRGDHVLRFPVIHRQRLYAVKKELLHMHGYVDAVALALASLLLTGMSGHGNGKGRIGFSSALALLLSGALTAFCMRMGCVMVNIITTEHLRFASPGDVDPNTRLFAALQDQKRPVWQALALQDLAHMSQGGPSERWRRSAIFDDESGQCWSTVVQHCLGEVEEMVSRTAAGLPQSSKPVEKKPAAAPIWNMHAASFKAFGGGNRAQEQALSYQRSRCWHAMQSVRSLSSLCVASYSEDRLGTAQLAQPNLGAVTGVLASMVLAMQAFVRLSGASGKGANLELAQRQSSLTGGRREAAVPAFALQDAALTALYGLVGCFGRDLEPLVRGSSHKLPYGTGAEAAALLARCSALQE